MLWRLRDAAPAALVPAAWLATAAAHADALPEEGMFVAHLVMAAFIAFFAVTGWSAMANGALRAWRLVLATGFCLTVVGIGGFLFPSVETPLLTTSLVGWMVLPAAGLAYTARELPEARLVYDGGAALSVLGAVLYLLTVPLDSGALAAGAFVCVGAGQAAGILHACVWA